MDTSWRYRAEFTIGDTICVTECFETEEDAVQFAIEELDKVAYDIIICFQLDVEEDYWDKIQHLEEYTYELV